MHCNLSDSLGKTSSALGMPALDSRYMCGTRPLNRCKDKNSFVVNRLCLTTGGRALSTIEESTES